MELLFSSTTGLGGNWDGGAGTVFSCTFPASWARCLWGIFPGLQIRMGRGEGEVTGCLLATGAALLPGPTCSSHACSHWYLNSVLGSEWRFLRGFLPTWCPRMGRV